eukprot:2947397-Rhodomonas_salina.1
MTVQGAIAEADAGARAGDEQPNEDHAALGPGREHRGAPPVAGPGEQVQREVPAHQGAAHGARHRVRRRGARRELRARGHRRREAREAGLAGPLRCAVGGQRDLGHDAGPAGRAAGQGGGRGGRGEA